MALDALIISPQYQPGDDVGFNGQRCRKTIFSDILPACSVEVIVETGTWLGNTSGYMAQTSGCPVFSCELDLRFHTLARQRLAGVPNINLEVSDSRNFLKKLSASPVTSQCTFFYLDAHWYFDLPLVEELEIITAHWKQFVVMIDDFKVPDDGGYAYDDYGGANVLSLDLLAPSVRKHNLAVYFPAAPSRDETGSKRGCVVLAPHGPFSKKLSELNSLRPFK
jgi:hypothetical protein